MSTINFVATQKELLGNTDLKLEELNVQLVTRIEGQANPVGKPSHMPVKVTGMVDVAKTFKPEKRVRLVDENGQPREQTIDYHSGVIRADDLVQNFTPAAVINRMTEEGELFGLLRRLRIQSAALEQLRKGVDDGDFSDATIKSLVDERAAFLSTLKSTVSKITGGNLPDFAKNGLLEEMNKIIEFLEKSDGSRQEA